MRLLLVGSSAAAAAATASTRSAADAATSVFAKEVLPKCCQKLKIAGGCTAATARSEDLGRRGLAVALCWLFRIESILCLFFLNLAVSLATLNCVCAPQSEQYVFIEVCSIKIECSFLNFAGQLNEEKFREEEEAGTNFPAALGPFAFTKWFLCPSYGICGIFGLGVAAAGPRQTSWEPLLRTRH